MVEAPRGGRVVDVLDRCDPADEVARALRAGGRRRTSTASAIVSSKPLAPCGRVAGRRTPRAADAGRRPRRPRARRPRWAGPERLGEAAYQRAARKVTSAAARATSEVSEERHRIDRPAFVPACAEVSDSPGRETLASPGTRRRRPLDNRDATMTTSHLSTRADLPRRTSRESILSFPVLDGDRQGRPRGWRRCSAAAIPSGRSSSAC